MCGLVSFLIPSNFGFFGDEINIMYESLYLTNLRGADSTGIVGVGHDGTLSWAKNLGDVNDLFTNEFAQAVRKSLSAKGKLFFGHGRSATKGTVTVENAHPWEIVKPNGHKIYFMHNGTLDIYQVLPDFHKHDVDSFWLGTSIAKLGPEEVFSKANGPIACIWWDTEDLSLNFFRNKERPLHFAFTKKDDFLVMSELSALMFVGNRNGLITADKDVYQFPVHSLCKMFPTKKKYTDWDAVDQVSIKKDPAAQRKNWSYGGWRGDYLPFGIGADDGEENENWTFHDAISKRSYLYDLMSLREGYIDKVEFKDDQVITAFNSSVSNWSRTEVGKPYQDFLIEMAPDNESSCVLTFSDGKGTTWKKQAFYSVELAGHGTEPPVTVLKPNENKVEKVEERRQRSAAKVIPIDLKADRLVKWHSKEGKTVIRHKAKTEKTSPVFFDWYENSVDGRVEIGDYVVFEVYDTTPILRMGGEWCYAIGLLLNTDDRSQATCMNTNAIIKMSCEDAAKISMFGGNIKYIKVANEDCFKDTGAYIELLLDEDTVGEIADEDVKELAEAGGSLLN